MTGGELDLSREHEDGLADGVDALVLDRERIVHSAAFRRLEYKTQVFVALEGDNFRTRLTHTLEVAHLARRLAAALDLRSDLAEVVALGHDLGHPPFGHAGERALDECLREHGGFEHNVHSLRVVDYLEHPYPDFRGLNLTRVVRECLAKHRTRFDQPGPHALQDGRPPPLEGQVVALADRLAYGLHDLQDGLYAGLIDPAALDTLALWQTAQPVRPAADEFSWRGRLRPTIDRIQNMLFGDAVGHTQSAKRRAGLSPAMEPRVQALEAFLREQLYHHEELARMDERSKRTVTELFEALVARPALLPPRFAERVPEQGAQRVTTDYIAGMTDRFCISEHERAVGA